MNSPTKLAGTLAAAFALLANPRGATSDPGLAAPFTRITTDPVATEVMRSAVAAWGDYDNDGWLDLFIGNTQAGARNSLFHNNRNGTFAKVGTGPIATDVMDATHSAAWVDYNNDGWLDLAVTDLDGGRNYLYRNTGGGSFARVTAGEAGPIVSDVAVSVSITFADYDRDGLLDAFVANGALYAPEADFLYHNAGQGRFARANNNAITRPELSTTQGTWADYDDDGDLDLFVTNSQDLGNQLFRNDGGGTFTDVSQASGLAGFGDSSGSAWGDYDNDGDLDLFVTNLNLNKPKTRNFLYRNDGNGAFTKITDGSIVRDLGHFESAAWIDYDSDGWLDLFVSDGQPDSSARNRLYRNLGNGAFAPVTNGTLVTDFGNAGGVAWGDYNNDGFLDVAVANGTIFAAQRNGLYQNNGNNNSWIKLKCVGTISNRSAIGTKVRVKAVIGGKETWQLRQIVGSEGWLTFNALDVVVGLGDAAIIDTIQIEWPSGLTQELRHEAPRQTLTITEGVTLSMTRVNEQTIELTWPSDGHVLESTTNLSQPDWQPVPGVTGTSHRVNAEQSRFFRLRHL